MQSQKIKINGLNFQIYFWGNPKKPKLFFFHGWLDSGVSFEWMAQILKKDFFCIAVDMRGYGKSEHTKSPLGYFFMEYVADAHFIFKHFSPKEPVRVIGHSLGGGIISTYAGVYPERVSHLINGEGFLFPYKAPEEAPSRVRKWIDEINQLSFPIHENLEKISQRLIASNPRLKFDQAQFLAKHFSQKVRGGYQISADPKHKLPDPYLNSEKTFLPFWKNIQAKTLLVSADETEMKRAFPKGKFKAIVQERLAQFPKHSKKITLKDCGHMMHQEKPEELAEISREFLLK